MHLVEAEEENYSEICFITEGEVKIMRQDTDKKKEAMTRMEMRISKEDKALIEQKARKARNIKRNLEIQQVEKKAGD